MTDFRSLEQKYRQMRIDEAEARNTAARKKVENVGRPQDDNKDPETSKLAKQGEIKTKIIDEAKNDKIKDMEKTDKKADTDLADKEAKTITGGKTEVETHPKTDDRPEETTMEDEKGKKAANKANKEQGTKGAKLKEEKWIQKAIKHKGALHKQLHVPADEPIPAEKLNAAAEKGGKLGQRARLAKTLKRIVKEK